MKTLLVSIISFCYGSYLTANYLDRPFVERKQTEIKDYIMKSITPSNE
jgi:hypothetical protein